VRVLQIIWFSAIGGVESYAQRLFPELERRGHENIVMCAGTEPERDPQRKTYLIQAISHTGTTSSSIALAALEGVLNEQNPDLAFVHTVLDSRVASFIMKRVPTVFFAHNYGPICPAGALLYERTGAVCQLANTPSWRCFVNAYKEKCNTRRPQLLVRSHRRANDFQSWTKRADKVVCGSDYVARRYVDAGFDSSRLRVLPYPVPVPDISSQPRTPETNRTILYSGRLVAQKGVETLLTAIGHINPDWKLVIAGDGPLLASLQAHAKVTGLDNRVEFLGPISAESMGQIYSAASIVVVPSLWPEPMGMVGPEAFSYERPVVASNVGGISQWLIDNVTGLAATPGDASDLAAKLTRLIENPSLGRRLARTGRLLVERNFTFEHHLDELIPMFQDVVRARRAVKPHR
jgi:glycosyltransferase involved in cell wall biosynthesis